MDWLPLIAGGLAIFAFMAHAFIGDKEFLSLRPEDSSEEKLKDTWVQTRAGWHWVSVDLLFSGLLLMVIGLSDFISAEKTILAILAIYYFCCGFIWLVTVAFSKTSPRQMLVLGQWMFCFLMAGLIYLASI